MRQKGTESYDLISVFFLALSAFACVIAVLVMGDMISAGPFEPKIPTSTSTQAAVVTITPTPPTPSATPEGATATFTPSATWTDFPTNTPSHTPTSSPSNAPTITLTWTPSITPSITQTLEPPTATLEPPTETPLPPTATATSMAFILNVQQGTPLYRDAYLHPGCAWQGIAGQITLDGGSPGLGYMVKVTGDGVNGELTQITGTNTNYGNSGWEIQVAGGTTAGNYRLTVFSADGVRQLAPSVDLSFPNDCQRNLILINFVQVQPFSQ